MSGRTVFVNNLKYEARESDLIDFFKEAGKVRSVTLFTRDGRSKGCAVVEFETEAQARKAFELQDKDLMGRPVNVCEDRPEEERERRRNYGNNGNGNWRAPRRMHTYSGKVIKISGYTENARWQDIKDFVDSVFQKPDYAECFNMADEHFAIIRFDDESLLPGAVKAINGQEFMGSKVKAIETTYRNDN